MIRRVSHLGLGLAAAIGVLLAGTALAGPMELSLSSGGSSTGNMSISNGGVYSNADFNGWNVSYLTPTSNSPTADPWGLNLSGFTASCVSLSGCADLTISLSGTGFTTPVAMSGFGIGLTNNNSMGPTAMTGTLQQTAYYDMGNSFFGNSNTIGSLTLKGFGSSFANGGGPTTGSYSLTLVDTFSSSCKVADCAIFAIDSSIGAAAATSTTVPEPGTLALFAAGLLGCALWMRRRARQS